MPLPTWISVPARKAWAWLLEDYHWVWVVLFPLGVIYLVAKFTEPKIEVVGSEQAGADKKRVEVLETLSAKDAEAQDVRDRTIAGAQQGHDAAVSTQVTEQAAHVQEYQDNPDELTSAMLRAGKEIRR